MYITMEINESYIKDMKTLHDKCKENPFWKTLSIDFHTSAVDELRQLANRFFSFVPYKQFNTCPQLFLVDSVMHNINDSILKAKLSYKWCGKNITETSAFGTYIMCLQAYMQVIHNFIDDLWDDSIAIYEPIMYRNETDDDMVCKYRTYTARQNDDGTYRILRIINKDEIPELLKQHHEMVKRSLVNAECCYKTNSNSVGDDFKKRAEYHTECMKDLDDNKEKYYIIK